MDIAHWDPNALDIVTRSWPERAALRANTDALKRIATTIVEQLDQAQRSIEVSRDLLARSRAQEERLAVRHASRRAEPAPVPRRQSGLPCSVHVPPGEIPEPTALEQAADLLLQAHSLVREADEASTQALIERTLLHVGRRLAGSVAPQVVGIVVH